MGLIVQQTGDTTLLTNALATSTFTIGLFTSNTQPQRTDALSAYTDSGLGTFTLAGASWTTPTINASGAAQATYPTQTWTNTTTVTSSVYGYYVQNSGTLVWSERFPTTSVLEQGNTVAVTPLFTMISAN